MNDLFIEKPATLRHQVENALRQAIASGRFKPGERLIERELCALLGVSRPSLREALRKLEADGLIRIVPHKGPFIPTISEDEAREIYAIRALLEGFAAREYARLINPEKAASLQATVAALHMAASAGNRDALLDAKTRFYQVLLDGCENRVASDMLLMLLFRINLLRGTTLSHPERLPRSLKEIDAICALICAGDAEGAERAARDHVGKAQAIALEVLRTSGYDADAPAPSTKRSNHE